LTISSLQAAVAVASILAVLAVVLVVIALAQELLVLIHLPSHL